MLGSECTGAPYGDCWPNHIWAKDNSGSSNYSVLWLHGGGTGYGERSYTQAFSVRCFLRIFDGAWLLLLKITCYSWIYLVTV